MGAAGEQHDLGGSSEGGHRPWPIPERPWVMRQTWLTDRYCLYTGEAHGTVLRGEIDHAPWPLQPAEARLQVDSLVASHGIRLPDTLPLLHFCRRLTMHAWLPESI